MMRTIGLGLILSACMLTACNQQDAASPAGQKSPGRYSGIGTFDAGRLWQEMKGAPSLSDAAAAKLADDEHVIVVLDSHTGEVRQCGDHSGFCVTMNPWATGSQASAAPVMLVKHASDLDSENETSSTKSASTKEDNEDTAH